MAAEACTRALSMPWPAAACRRRAAGLFGIFVCIRFCEIVIFRVPQRAPRLFGVTLSEDCKIVISSVPLDFLALLLTKTHKQQKT